MCNILILEPKQALTHALHTRNSLLNNDGIGVMVYADRLVTYKTVDMRCKRIWQLDKQYRHFTRVYHYRMATSGIVSDTYAHPFLTRHGALMHNGVVAGMSCRLHSDTHNLAATIDQLELPHALRLLASVSGKYALCLRTKRDMKLAEHISAHTDDADSGRILLFGHYTKCNNILMSSPYHNVAYSNNTYDKYGYSDYDDDYDDWITYPYPKAAKKAPPA